MESLLITGAAGFIGSSFLPKSVSPAPAEIVPQTIDLGPTILKHFDATAAEFPGIRLHGLSVSDPRKIFPMMTTSVPDIENPRKFSKYLRLPDGKWEFFEDVKTTR